MTKADKLQAGIFLKATQHLNDSYFEGALIYIAAYNAEGALGYVVNNPFPRRFNELVEFINSPPFMLYEGGPVAHEKLFFLHRRPELVTDSDLIAGGIYSGGDFKKAVSLMNAGTLTANDFRLFIGYSGWDAGELEMEISEGSWEVSDKGSLF